MRYLGLEASAHACCRSCARDQVRERVARVFLAALLCAKLQTRPDEAVGYSLDP